MRRFLLIACIPLLVLPLRAVAQEPECYRVTPDAAKIIAEANKGRCEIVCRGCGCKGGPGYREKTGRKQCVSWDDLFRKCGADYKRCDRECTPVVEACETPKIPTSGRTG